MADHAHVRESLDPHPEVVLPLPYPVLLINDTDAKAEVEEEQNETDDDDDDNRNTGLNVEAVRSDLFRWECRPRRRDGRESHLDPDVSEVLVGRRGGEARRRRLRKFRKVVVLAFRNFDFRFFFVRDFVLEQIRDEVVPKCDLVRQVVGFHIRLKSCKHMFGYLTITLLTIFFDLWK